MSKFKITNTEVYGLQESIVASGYPMMTNENNSLMKAKERDIHRIKRLAKTPNGSGHDCALKGITVQADITAPQYWWMQFQRYHFADIISSQSKMHRITKMDISKQCNEHVNNEIIDIIRGLVDAYNNHDDYKKAYRSVMSKAETFQKIISNCPMGLMLTARITTNYLQLKTMYKQRKGHKLEEWHNFCNWVEGLRMSNLITSLE